jgi:hypothetical protein
MKRSTWWRPFGFCAAKMMGTVRERVTGNCQNHGSKNKASSRTTKPGPQVRKERGENKQFQCESSRAMEQAFQRNQTSKKCSAVQKIAEKRVEIVRCKRKKKSDEKQLKKLQSTALKIGRTVRMDHVRRRLSSSSNNVSNMRLDGAMGIPLQAVL